MARETGRRRRHGWLAPVAVGAVLAGVVSSGVMVWKASEAAFSGTTVNSGNTWAAGTVTLTDDDSGSAMFSPTGLKPSSTGSKCIKVTYTGSIDAGVVKIYGATPTFTTASSLAPYINIQIEVGTAGSTGAFANCATFSAASTIQAYTPLSTFGGSATNYSNGVSTGWTATVADPARVFRISYTVADNNLAQGMDCSMPFTWETQST